MNLLSYPGSGARERFFYQAILIQISKPVNSKKNLSNKFRNFRDA